MAVVLPVVVAVLAAAVAAVADKLVLVVQGLLGKEMLAAPDILALTTVLAVVVAQAQLVVLQVQQLVALAGLVHQVQFLVHL
jgi:hypothetical protein